MSQEAAGSPQDPFHHPASLMLQLYPVLVVPPTEEFGEEFCFFSSQILFSSFFCPSEVNQNLAI